MLSAGNIVELEQLGYHYIIGSRLGKTPYGSEEYLAENDVQMKDGQIFESSMLLTIGGESRKRRVVYQYRQKRAAIDLLNIDRTLAKAQKMVDKKVDIKRNRFLSIQGEKREINKSLVDEARRKAGIKGYVIDLDIPAQQIIDAYHNLFQVEKSFRMSKSDLKARPVFHHKRESIDAHLTVVFSALGVARCIERITGMSISRFVKMLKPIRTGIISIPLKPKIPKYSQDIIDLLN